MGGIVSDVIGAVKSLAQGDFAGFAENALKAVASYFTGGISDMVINTIQGIASGVANGANLAQTLLGAAANYALGSSGAGSLASGVGAGLLGAAADAATGSSTLSDLAGTAKKLLTSGNQELDDIQRQNAAGLFAANQARLATA